MSVPSPARDPNHAGHYNLGLLGVALPHPHASAGCVGINSTPMMAYTTVRQLGPRKRVSFSAQSEITLVVSAPSTPSASSSTLHLAAATSSDPPFSFSSPEQPIFFSANSFFDISATGPIPIPATADLTLRRSTSLGETTISPPGSSGRGFCHRGSLFQAAIDERRRKNQLGLPEFLGGSAVSGSDDDGTTRDGRSGVRRVRRSQSTGDSGEGGCSAIS